jgi:hypothetical protein
MKRPNQSLQPIAVHSIHLYALRARKDKRGVDLISDALLFGRPWSGDPDAIQQRNSVTPSFTTARIAL